MQRNGPVMRPLVLALALGMGAPAAHAALGVEVLTTDDAGGTGDCTLRQAIASMNAQSVAGTGCIAVALSGMTDTITFDTAVFPPGGTNTITLADVPSATLEIIDGALAIDASANGNVTVQRARPADDETNAFGILRASTLSGSLRLDHLTIRNGRASVPPSGNYAGGGGVACFCASLVVNDSTISDNRAVANLGPGGLATGYGGGLYVYGGTLTIARSLVTGNSANAAGGGIAVYQGDLVLEHTTISDNSAQDPAQNARGGGIYTRPGDVSATDSLVSGNDAQRYGGGLLVGGELTLSGSTVSDNSAAGDGGGMKLLGGGTLTGSTISGNTAQRGAGIYDAAGYHVAMHPLTLAGSTVSGNAANSASGGKGGGIFSRYGGLYLTNTTLAGNVASIYGGGIYVMRNTVPIALTHATIAANSAGQRGGGVMIGTSDAASVASDASLFANTEASQGGGENIAVTIGDITISGDGNLLFSGGLVNVSFANAPVSGDPLLGPLQDNGGATSTMSPGIGGAAIDAYVPTGAGCPAATDQRGVRRPQGAGCDIGAVERVLDRIFADGFDGVPVPD
jgi:hypothetical protein